MHTDNITRKFAETRGEVSEKIGQGAFENAPRNIRCDTSIRISRIFTETPSRNFPKKKIAQRKSVENSKYYAFKHPEKIS